jgi:hypothetical protein
VSDHDSFSRSQYSHHAAAFGLAGKIDRPMQHEIPTQASVALAPSGGHGAHRVEKYEAPGILSFSAAYVEVGGGPDAAHNTHTTYSSSTIENLNIFNVVTADRIVSRLTVYHPSESSKDDGPSFSTVGSHFENLKIAGQKIDVPLANREFHDCTYKKFCDAGKGSQHPKNKWLVGNGLDAGKLDANKNLLGHSHGILKDLADRYKKWDPGKKQPAYGSPHRCSLANHLDLAASLGPESGLLNFGSIICVPRFGIIYLAELLIHPHHRHITMLRVHMCSSSGGKIDGGGASGGGSPTIPPT